MRTAAALACLLLLTCTSVVSQAEPDLKIVASPYYGLSATPAANGYRIGMKLLAPGTGWGAKVDSCTVDTKAERLDVRVTMLPPDKPGAAAPTPVAIGFDTGEVKPGAWPVLVWTRVGEGEHFPRAVLVLRVKDGGAELSGSVAHLRPAGRGKLEVTVTSLTGTYELDKLEKRDDNSDLRVHFECVAPEGARHTGPIQTREELKPGKLGKGWALLRVYGRDKGTERSSGELLQLALIAGEAPQPLGGASPGLPAAETGFKPAADSKATRASVVMMKELSQLIPATTSLELDRETLEFSLPLRQRPKPDAYKHFATRVSHADRLVEIVLVADAEPTGRLNAPVGLLLEGEYQLALWLRDGDSERLLDCVMMKTRNNLTTRQQPGDGVVGLEPYPATWAMVADEMRMGRPRVNLSGGASGFTAEISLKVNGAEDIKASRVEREQGSGLIRIHLETVKKPGGNSGVSADSTCKVELGELAVGWHRVELVRPTSGTTVSYGFGIHAE